MNVFVVPPVSPPLTMTVMVENTKSESSLDKEARWRGWREKSDERRKERKRCSTANKGGTAETGRRARGKPRARERERERDANAQWDRKEARP